jgi:hypothetical protein
VKVEGDYPRAKAAAALALDKIRHAHEQNELKLNEKELKYLDSLSETVAQMPQDVDEFTETMIGECDKLDPKKYDM